MFASKVIYTLKYYFVARRLDLARVSFAVFNGYCRLCNAVYGRLTESGAKDVRGNWYNCLRKFWKRGILCSRSLNEYGILLKSFWAVRLLKISILDYFQKCVLFVKCNILHCLMSGINKYYLVIHNLELTSRAYSPR